MALAVATLDLSCHHTVLVLHRHRESAMTTLPYAELRRQHGGRWLLREKLLIN